MYFFCFQTQILNAVFWFRTNFELWGVSWTSLSHVWLLEIPRAVVHLAPLSMVSSRQDHWSGCVGCSVVSNSLWPHGLWLPGSSVHGILQARILQWVAIPFSGGSTQPRDRTQRLPHCKQILYPLSHQGNPEMFLRAPKISQKFVLFSYKKGDVKLRRLNWYIKLHEKHCQVRSNTKAFFMLCLYSYKMWFLKLKFLEI